MTFAQTVRIHLAYKGTNFRGYAENPGVRTVGGELRKAIEQILGTPIDVTVAGRTDAGVHAQGQVASFRGSYERLDHEQLKDRLNSLCPADITIQSVSVVDDEFDARFSALHREYRYRILNSEHSDPLYADLEWHIPQPLNLQAMEEAATCLLGTHDFTSFCRRPKGNLDASMTRKILAAKWEPKAEERVEFEIIGNAFCHQMVRSLVGFCVAVGLGKSSPQEFERIVDAQDRSAAPPIAPPHGLILTRVAYPVAFDEKTKR